MKFLISYRHFRVAVALLLAAISFAARDAHACPTIHGLVDINCDRRLTIVCFGDSITYGLRDATGLGYPGRLAKLLPLATIINLGDVGEDSYGGRARAGRLLKTLRAADYVIVLEGTNDYFLALHSAPETTANLSSIVSSGKSTGGVTMLSTLTATKRGFQRGWISEVNGQIRSLSFFDFFSLGVGIIGFDQLHPNEGGYLSMAKYAVKRLKSASSRRTPADSDRDGVYDYEEKKYRLNARSKDTDGDGLTDAEELYVYKSNPRSRDGDRDGIPDLVETKTLRSNPSDAKPGAPRIRSLTAISPPR